MHQKIMSMPRRAMEEQQVTYRSYCRTSKPTKRQGSTALPSRLQNTHSTNLLVVNKSKDTASLTKATTRAKQQPDPLTCLIFHHTVISVSTSLAQALHIVSVEAMACQLLDLFTLLAQVVFQRRIESQTESRLTLSPIKISLVASSSKLSLWSIRSQFTLDPREKIIVSSQSRQYPIVLGMRKTSRSSHWHGREKGLPTKLMTKISSQKSISTTWINLSMR